MVRTKYYEANRIKKAVEKMMADGAENLEGSSFKGYLPRKDKLNTIQLYWKKLNVSLRGLNAL